jgi:hypothetical protein
LNGDDLACCGSDASQGRRTDVRARMRGMWCWVRFERLTEGADRTSKDTLLSRQKILST